MVLSVLCGMDGDVSVLCDKMVTSNCYVALLYYVTRFGDLSVVCKCIITTDSIIIHLYTTSVTL